MCIFPCILFIFMFHKLRPEQNGCHSTDNIFKCISWFLLNYCILIWLWPKSVPKGLINNKSTFILVVSQVARQRGGPDKISPQHRDFYWPKFQDIVRLKFWKSWTFPNFRTISVYINVNFICLWYTWGQNDLLQNLASNNPVAHLGSTLP